MALNQVVTYEEVKAYQAQYGIATYGVGSGGYTTGGIYVDWTTDGGFTGKGWQTDVSESPVSGWSEEEIRQEIRDKDNLDSVFKTWVENIDYNLRYGWIFNNVEASCRWEVR